MSGRQRVGDSPLTFRRTVRADFPLMRRWLSDPRVARFWNHETDDAAIERDFGGSIDGTEPSVDFIVELDDRPIGFIQRSEIWDYADEQRELIDLAAAPKRSLTVDYFIGETCCAGRGIGARMIREFTSLSFRDCPRSPSIIVPVISGNIASWKALESAGYSLIATGFLPPDNPVDDGEHRVYRRLRD